jgi:hypothetical protein
MSKGNAHDESTTMATRNTSLALLSVAVLVLTGCHKIVIAPADPVGAGGPVLISAQPSYITLPVTVKLSDVSTLVNNPQVVPEGVADTFHIHITIPHIHTHGLLRKPTVTHDPVEVAHIDYNAGRGDIKLAGSGDKISLNTSFKGGGRLVPPSATADANGSVAGSSTLTVAPDYSLVPVVDLKINIDHAAVLHGISVKGLVQDKVNDAINKSKGQIGPALSRMVDLRKRAEEAWRKLPASIAVPGANDLWISLDPQAFMLDGPHANADTVTAVLSLKAQVKTLLQAEQPVAPVRAALPNISGGPADNKFHLAMPIEVVPEELNKQLALLIRDKAISRVEFDNGSEVAVINAVTVFPSGNQFYLKVGFAGVKGKWAKSVRGTLICEVHPVLSADKQTLSFDKIDYTVETAKTLKGLGLEVLLNTGRPIIVSILQKKIVVPFSHPLQQAKSKANAEVAKLKLPPPITVKFNLDDLAPQDLLAYGNKIYLGFAATGLASATY